MKPGDMLLLCAQSEAAVVGGMTVGAVRAPSEKTLPAEASEHNVESNASIQAVKQCS